MMVKSPVMIVKGDMTMKIRTFGRHIKEGFRSIRRNGWMSFAAVSAVSITLLLVGALIATVLNINDLASDIEDDVSIRVYIDVAAEGGENEEEDTETVDENIENLQSEIEALPNVQQVVFSSRDEELDNIVGSYGDTFELFQGDQNPLHNVLVVDTSSPDEIAEVADEISQMEYVSEVNYGGAEADRLFDMTSNIQNIGGIIIVALIFTAVFLISNTIRITILSRSTEIEIMKLVGATDWFIRWPFLIEGALIGFVGSIIPSVVLWFLYNSVYTSAESFLSGTYMSLIEPSPFMFQLILGLSAIGIVIGSLGSALSIRRFLKV